MTVGAALATILASAHSCGFFGDQSTRLTVANLAVQWIGVAPAADTAHALGDTLRYVATVTDRRGAALAGAAIAWATGDPSVALVDSAGFVIARGPGATDVIVTAGEKAARARIVVRPRAVRLELGVDSVIRLAEGERRTLAVTALDARGNRIGRAHPRLESADTAIVAVDPAGALAGRGSGRARITAMLDDLTDSATVEVLPSPARLLAIEGQAQRAVVGTRVPEPIAIRVESHRGRPVPDVTLRLRTVEGGAVKPDLVVTGKDGIARAVWTLGDVPGRQRITVSSTGLDSTLTIEAEADPSAANTRIAALGVPATAPAGEGRVRVGVQLTDSLGRLLAGVPVAWTALDGGAIQASEARTDSLGESRVEWKLGPHSGSQRARVLVGTGRAVPAFTVRAIALPGAAANVVAANGTRFDGPVGAALSRGVIVRVTDSAGNPVPAVALVATPKAGAVPDSALTTDSSGRATVRWTLGEKAGYQTLAVSAPGLPSLELTAHARPRAAANVSFLTQPAAARAGRVLPMPVRVLVTDAFGNAVARELVVFRPSAGRVAPARVMTATDGTAVTTWTPATKAGEQSISAVLTGRQVGDRLELVVAAGAGAGSRSALVPPIRKVQRAKAAASRSNVRS
jgi:hypothetical protein